MRQRVKETRHICTIEETRISQAEDRALPRRMKFLRALQKLRLASERHPSTEKHLKSSYQIIKENERLLRSYPSFIVHPFSLLRMSSDVIVFIVMNLHLTLLPFAFSFLAFDSHPTRHLVEYIDLFLCLILVVEFGITFCTGFVVFETNEIVLEPGKIFFNRLRPFRLMYDLLLFLPYILLLEVFDELIYEAGAESCLVFVLFLYLCHIARFRDSNRYFRVIARSLQMPESKTRIVQVIMNTLFVLHWTTCLGYIIPILLQAKPSTRTFDEEELLSVMRMQLQHPNVSAVLQHVANPFVRLRVSDVESNASTTYRYFRSMMVTLRVGMAASEKKDIEQHFVYHWIMMLVMFLGWLWFNYVPVVLCRFFDSPEMATDQYDKFMANLKAFAHNKHLSGPLQKKLRNNFATRFRTRYFDEEMIMGLFPKNLRSSIRMETCRHLVASVDLFKNLPYFILTDIVNCLQLEIYLQDDVIIAAGSYGDSMYFLAMGTVAVYALNGKELGHLTDGAYFGEISLIKRNQQRTANVIALEACEIYRLSHEDFQNVIKPHAYLLNRIRKQAEQRLSVMKKKKDKMYGKKFIEAFLQ
ncbi:potassium/sodium hyperpolarization-activated cyclic nucleotide-gated channel 4-like [Anopheles maculipalpis]|uniref:potassium/sodium hyperpolarization-activated cyclic nucleotide-gated channel 4-like n=1 Tax=Anopheles maculipalpis TaxID=1496333 RepID=UPI0021595A41|nr:potassium/sodium hyperpolarization-activated cyclic nucleotide-gated channel 4-like [Anopheles maculipalpis]